MRAWASLSSWIKRPAVWLGGFLVAAAGTYVTTNLMPPVQTFLAKKTAEKACQYQQTPINDESQFIILVSPLKDDADGSHSEKVKSAFHGQKGFHVVPICEPVGFDYTKDLQTAEVETQKRAWELIKARHADFLLFGEVRERDKAVKIWAVNEHGGCDLHPKPTIIEHGDLPGGFTDEQKENLIEVSLEQIQSACLYQSSIVWSDFARRMNKMEMFVNHFDFSQPKYLHFASSYIQAMRLLYGNGQGDVWFSKGEEFAKRVINKDQDKDQGTDEGLSSIYTEYAVLLDERFGKTNNKNDQDAAFGAVGKAISLDPKNAFAYQNRGILYSEKGELDRAIDDFTKAMDLDPEYGRTYCYCHRGTAYLRKGDFDRAIEDFTKAIDLDPKDAEAYNNRGDAYSAKGDMNRAIEDYTKAINRASQAIRLDGKSADAWNSRCWARAITGQLQQALSDCNQSLDLQPNDADARDRRAFVYIKMGKLEDAITDYNIALRLNPSLAASLYGRGVAKLKKGDADSGNSDVKSAKRIQPHIADTFQRYGIDVKETSQSPPRSQTSRTHRSRRQGAR